MNPSTALARVVVDELVRNGITEVVVSPGSRSAPLAMAVADADANGLLTLHVRVDERAAAFTALGLAKAAGAPTAVITTSGTAVANLHPGGRGWRCAPRSPDGGSAGGASRRRRQPDPGPGRYLPGVGACSSSSPQMTGLVRCPTGGRASRGPSSLLLAP